MWWHCVDSRLHRLKIEIIEHNFQDRVVAAVIAPKDKDETMSFTADMLKERGVEYLIIESHPDCAAVQVAKGRRSHSVLKHAWENIEKIPDVEKYSPAELIIMVAQEVTKISVANAIKEYGWDPKKVIGLFADFKNKYQVLVDNKFIPAEKLTEEQKQELPQWLIEKIMPKTKEDKLAEYFASRGDLKILLEKLTTEQQQELSQLLLEKITPKAKEEKWTEHLASRGEGIKIPMAKY
jgi:hypothetical protein